MMKTIVDKDGTSWQVDELASHGVGARGEHQRLPKPLSVTVRFIAEDGRKIVRTANHPIEKMTDEQLLDLLNEPSE